MGGIIKESKRIFYLIRFLYICVITTVIKRKFDTLAVNAIEVTPDPVPREPIDLTDFNSFQNRNCIVFITNFAKVDIIEGIFPVIIYNRPRRLYQHVYIWYCIESDFYRFALRTRPWNCQLELDLFPARADENICNIWEYGKRVAGNITDEDFRTTLPSRVPSIHVFVVGETWESDVEKYGRGAVLREWIYNAMIRSNGFRLTRNKHFFIAEVNESGDGRYHLSQVQEISPYHCLDCKFKDMPIIRSTHVLQLSLDMSVLLGELGYASEVITNWDLTRIHPASSGSDNIINHFAECQNILSHDSLHLGSQRRIDRMIQKFGGKGNGNLMAHVVVHAWISIMQNYSYPFVDQAIGMRAFRCVNGITEEDEEARNDHRYQYHFSPRLSVRWGKARKIHLPLYVPDPFSALQFVSCGRRGWRPFPFNELVGVYDSWIWICIAVSVAAIVIIWRGLVVGEGLHVPKLMSLFKILLEQGDPFPVRTFVGGDAKLRLMLGAFLLVGIVLSNAYKNTNVYNMVTPRAPLRYETLEQLTKDNFSIYTRAGTIDFPMYYLGMISFWNSSYDSKLTMMDRHHVLIASSTTVQSEVKNLNMEVDDIRYYENDGLITMSKLLKKVTGLYPRNLATIIRDSFINEYPWYLEFRNMSIIQVITRLKKMHAELEEGVLLKDLSGCNKTALVAPPTVAQLYKRRLDGKGAYLGKELYLQPGFQFQIAGMVKSSFLVRLAYFKESGILERWTNILSSISTPMLNSTEMIPSELESESGPARASMQGNILVVFALVVGGLILATFAFLLELFIHKSGYCRFRTRKKS